MTYIVADRNVVIADKILLQDIGRSLTGRKSLDKAGFFNLDMYAPGVKVTYRDAKKIVPLRNGFHKGVRITHLSMSGSITFKHELIHFLERGGDIDYYMDAEAVVPGKERRNFGPGKTTMWCQEDGKIIMAYGDSTKGITINDDKGKIMHIGCGVSWVDGINPHLKQKLTPLECFVVASHYDENVSEEFDYLNRQTGVITYNQKLTPRQRSKILVDIQSRFALDGDICESDIYVN